MQTTKTPRRRRLPHWRIFSWVIVAFNLLMLVWIIAGAATASSAAGCGHAQAIAGIETAKQAASSCHAAADVGTAIGVAALIAVWVAGDIILGVLWLVTRPRGRLCPACGTTAKRGVTSCRSCGHNFAFSPQATSAAS